MDGKAKKTAGMALIHENTERHFQTADDQVIFHILEQTPLCHGIRKVVPGNVFRHLEQTHTAEKVPLLRMVS